MKRAQRRLGAHGKSLGFRKSPETDSQDPGKALDHEHGCKGCREQQGGETGSRYVPLHSALQSSHCAQA